MSDNTPKTVEGYASIHTVTNGDPQGTAAELVAHNMALNNYGSCAKRKPNGEDTVLGCPWWAKCQFSKNKGVDGPVNVGVAVVLSPAEGAYADGKVMPCHAYYGSGLAERARQAMLSGTGEIIRVIAIQGDGKKIKERGSERLHPQPDKGCLDCMDRDATCIRMKEVMTEREVPRLGRMWENKGMAYGGELRAEMLADLRAQADRHTLEEHARLGRRVHAVKLGLEEVAEARKVVERAVSRKECAEAFGEERITDLPDGTWTCDLKTWNEMKLFDEMDEARVRADMDRGFRQHAAIRDVILENRETGLRIVVPEHQAEFVARARGMVERPRYRATAKFRYTSTGRLVKK